MGNRKQPLLCSLWKKWAWSWYGPLKGISYGGVLSWASARCTRSRCFRKGEILSRGFTCS
jgi:hypothetical protein